MGGLTTLANLAKEEAPSIFRSTEHILSESPIGKAFAGFMKDKLEPAIGKEAMRLSQTGLNPDQALYEAKRSLMDSTFGKNRAGFISMLKTAQRQKGPIHASEMGNALSIMFHDESPYWRTAAKKAGIAIKESSPYSNPGGLEKATKALSGPMFLPRIAIPHAPQAVLNSLAVNGLKETVKAFADFGASPQAAMSYALRSGAMAQELAYEFKQAAARKTSFSMLLDPLRKVFNLERRWGIAFSAVSGKHAALDAADEFINSQGASKWGEVQLKVLGINPQDVLSRGGLSDSEIETAAFRSASEIMGFKSPLETPFQWERNGMTRMATIFKHYGFRQARLIKYSLQRAKEVGGWAGVAKQASILGTSFFAAGELVKATEDLVSGKEPWNADEEKDNLLGSEFLDGIAHAGGFGIMYSILRSARHNHLGGFIMGPHIGSAVDLTQDIINGRGKAIGRDILRKFGLPGTYISNTVLPPTKGSKKSKDWE